MVPVLLKLAGVALAFAGMVLAQPITTSRVTILPLSDASSTGELRFREKAANGVNYTGFKAPDSLAANVIYTLPGADATTSGFCLTSNAAKVLSWADCGAGGASNFPVVDTLGLFTGSGDATKRFWFDADAFIPTATDRVLTIQNADYILAGLNVPDQVFETRQVFARPNNSAIIEILGNNASVGYTVLRTFVATDDFFTFYTVKYDGVAESLGTANIEASELRFNRNGNRIWMQADQDPGIGSNEVMIGLYTSGIPLASSAKFQVGVTATAQHGVAILMPSGSTGDGLRILGPGQVVKFSVAPSFEVISKVGVHVDDSVGYVKAPKIEIRDPASATAFWVWDNARASGIGAFAFSDVKLRDGVGDTILHISSLQGGAINRFMELKGNFRPDAGSTWTIGTPTQRWLDGYINRLRNYEFIESTGTTSPGASPATQGRIYFDSACPCYKVSENGGAYVNLIGASGTFNTHLLPGITDTYDIGNGATPLRWRDVYSNTYNAYKSGEQTHLFESDLRINLDMRAYSNDFDERAAGLFKRYRGTRASPLPISSGDRLGALGWFGWAGDVISLGARMSIYATSVNFSGANRIVSGAFLFDTTNVAGTTATRWVMAADGNMHPGTNDAYTFGTDSLRVNRFYGYHADFAPAGTLGNQTKIRDLLVADQIGGTAFYLVGANASASNSNFFIRDNSGINVIEFRRMLSSVTFNNAILDMNFLPATSSTRTVGSTDARWGPGYFTGLDITPNGATIAGTTSLGTLNVSGTTSLGTLNAGSTTLSNTLITTTVGPSIDAVFPVGGFSTRYSTGWFVNFNITNQLGVGVGGVVPTSSGTTDLGQSGLFWRQLFVNSITSGTILPITNATYNLGGAGISWNQVRGTTFYAAGNAGLTQTFNVRNAADTGSCSIQVQGGIILSTTC